MRVAGITERVAITDRTLISVRGQRAVVASVANAIAIEVALIRVRRSAAVVIEVAEAIAIVVVSDERIGLVDPQQCTPRARTFVWYCAHHRNARSMTNPTTMKMIVTAPLSP